ncbi:MAG: peptide chain release factor N(5)-glutamine methyltransferase [Candidatus Baltobacteraceae bacterium]
MSTLAQLLQRGTTNLRATSATPRADALHLLAHAAARPRAWILAHEEARPGPEAASLFERLVQERNHGRPIAYLLESAGFYGREFCVNERVLVPRPETEHLVEAAIAHRPRRALDVGTGSGAIACTIAAETDALIDATDISADAIKIAQHNATQLGVADRCTFHHGDLAEPVRGRQFDLIVANLPYVPSSDLPPKPNPLAFEPELALDGGPDGLTLYRKFLPTAPALLAPGGLLLLEAAPPTIEKLRELTQSTFPDCVISVGLDYAGLARYIKTQT